MQNSNFFKTFKACRFNKCLMVGMKRECIMSDEQILKKVSYFRLLGKIITFSFISNLIFSEHLLREIV